VIIKKQNKLLLVIILSGLLYGCANTSVKDSAFQYVPLGEKKFDKTQVEEIKVFKDRSQIKDKYFEIGIIKTVGDPNTDKITIEAAVRGAHAIIKNGNDYIIIRYYGVEDKKKDDKLTRINRKVFKYN